MSGFKDMVARDIHKVFLNVDEFAEKLTIKYAGQVYEDIPVSLQELDETDRQQLSDDHAQGLHLRGVILLCAAKDLGGRHLEMKDPIEIIRRKGRMQSAKKYTIASSSCEMGMIEAKLVAVK